MTTRLAHPEVVGTLDPSEAAAFSQDFYNDWDTIPPNQRLISAEDILLFDRDTEQAGILVPVTHEQFLPAIKIAVEHERTVRAERKLIDAILTTRQSVAQPGRSQQGDFGTIVHRDSAQPDDFYTVSDTNPTQYYPDIVSTRDSRGSITLSEEEVQQGIAFKPFDIVRASTMMYHRSPTVTIATRRTFMRLVFHYDHNTWRQY
jgi:hypothetical protein